MVATLILSLRLRIAEAGHLAVFHQNLSGGKAVPFQLYLSYFDHNLKYPNSSSSSLVRGSELTLEHAKAHMAITVKLFKFDCVKIKTRRFIQRVSLWLGPKNDGGIGRQHIYPTDNEIVITMF